MVAFLTWLMLILFSADVVKDYHVGFGVHNSCFPCAFIHPVVTIYVQICMDHILAVLRIPAERASGFIALGEMAGALDGELVTYLPTITSHLRDAVCDLYNLSGKNTFFDHDCQITNSQYLLIHRLLHVEAGLPLRPSLVWETLQKPWVLPWNLVFVVFWMLCLLPVFLLLLWKHLSRLPSGVLQSCLLLTDSL